eukprot:gene7099-7666_t
MPIFVNVKTQLGVNYDAGHWFHMAENIMVEHSILRKKDQLINNSIIFYNFDKKGFVDDLNSITRFVIYLGTILPKPTTIQSIYYLEYPSLWKKHLKVGDAILIDSHNLMKQKMQSLSLSSDIIPSSRFSLSSQPSQGLHVKAKDQHLCMKYMGTLGGRWPTPQRGSWYPNPGDIETFRQKIKDACPPNPSLLESQKKQKKYKLVVYQRDLSRKLANEEEALTMLRSQLPSDQWEISVLMHSNRRSPCELAHLLHNVDVFLTPHGFQSMLLLFLPRPAILFEVFPYKYYKRGYGPFSAEYGVIHSGVMSPGTLWHTRALLWFMKTSWCMQSKYCRGYARNQDVILTQHGVNKLIDVIEKNRDSLISQEENKNKIISKRKRDFIY